MGVSGLKTTAIIPTMLPFHFKILQNQNRYIMISGINMLNEHKKNECKLEMKTESSEISKSPNHLSQFMRREHILYEVPPFL